MIIIIISFLANKAYLVENRKRLANISNKNLPNLPFLFICGSTEKKNSMPIIINYFSPDCDHCIYMVSKIKENKEFFSKSHIYMITSSNIHDVNTFQKENGIDSLQFITVGIDTSFSFYKIFGSSQIPSFYIYNSKGILDTIFKGETKIENIIHIINPERKI